MNEYIIWILANPVLSIGILLIEYAVIMTMATQRKFDGLAKLATIVFIPQDLLMNVIVLTVIFADTPKEWLVTGRMKRYKAVYNLPINRNGKLDNWRYYFASQMCRYLNKFDEGHC